MKCSIIRVGGGRGFVVADHGRNGFPPLVVTAAHCLPKMPPAHLARYLDEETFLLLAPLSRKPAVYASVIFYDPIADVAVLAQPDDQAMDKQAEAYETLLAQYAPVTIAVPRNAGKGFVYDLAGRPRPITYQRRGWSGLQVEGYKFQGGMSGSPIVDAQGRALALVSTGDNMASPCLFGAIPSRIRLHVKGGNS